MISVVSPQFASGEHPYSLHFPLQCNLLQGDSPGGPQPETPCSQCRRPSSVPGGETTSHKLQLTASGAKNAACLSWEHLQADKLYPLLASVVLQLLNCVWLCPPMDCSTSDFPVLHYLLEFAQTHVPWVSDAIQPSHPVARFSSYPQSFPASWHFVHLLKKNAGDL